MLTTKLATFQQNTMPETKLKGRGSLMSLIDAALTEYEDKISTASDADEIRLLNEVFQACKYWLKMKYEKSESRKTLIFVGKDEVNKLFEKRRTAVLDLGNEALTEIFTRLRAHGVLTPDHRGEYEFNKHRLRALATTKVDRIASKSLDREYQPERESYLASGKTAAIAGSGVHNTYKSITDSKKAGTLNALTGVTKKGLAAAKKDLHKLSLDDYEVLDTIGRANVLSGDLSYFRRNERYKYLAIPNGGQLIDYQERPISTSSNDVTMYAMDRYGNLLFKNAKTLGSNYFFNHSSFNAGNDVICAGVLSIERGFLTEIDNESGHYKPDRTNLHNCLKALVLDGVDITRLQVNVFEFVGSVKTKYQYTGTVFYNDKDAPADRGEIS